MVTRWILLAVGGLMAVALTAAALWGPESEPAVAGGTIRYGDATCDGLVNAVDALFILQVDARLLGALPCPRNADVNRDGRTDSLDALAILQYEAGLIPSLPVTPGQPSPTPRRTATPTRTPTQQFITFGNGTQIIGTDIPAGTYRTRLTNASCYWARLSGFGGTLDEIIVNNFTDGPEVVTIAPTDAGFESSGCAMWSSDLSAVTAGLTEPFGYGTFMVGIDIAPGTWRASSGETCYWARLTGFGGTLSEIITNDFGGATVVTIDPSDVGFTSSRCGTWTRVN